MLARGNASVPSLIFNIYSYSLAGEWDGTGRLLNEYNDFGQRSVKAVSILVSPPEAKAFTAPGNMRFHWGFRCWRAHTAGSPNVLKR